jgi:WD40 repeat protein
MTKALKIPMKTSIVFALLALVVLPLVPAPAAPPAQRTDAEGFPLPEGVVTRIGSARFRHDYFLERMAWSPDGKRIAAAGFWRGIRVWRFDNGTVVRHVTPESLGGRVLALSFDGNGSHLVAAVTPEKGNVLLASIDVGTGAVEKKSLGTKHELGMNWAFGRGAQRLAARGDKDLVLFDTAMGRELKRLHRPVPAKELQALDVPDLPDSLAVARRADVYAQIEDIEEKTVITLQSLTDGGRRDRFSFTRQEEPSPRYLSFAPDDQSLLVRCDEDSALGVYDVSARKWRWQVSTFPFHPGKTSFSPDGKIIAVAGLGTSPVFLDAQTGKLDPHTPDLFDRVKPLAFLHGGREVLVEHVGFEVRDAATGRLVRKVPSIPGEKRFVPWEWGTKPSPKDAYGWYWHFCCSSDARRVFGFADMRAYPGDGRTGEALPSFRLPVAKWCEVLCSSDGARLMCEAYQPEGVRLDVWDAVQGVKRHSLGDLTEERHQLVACDNPRFLLSCIDRGYRHKDTPPEKTTRLWDVGTGQLLGSFEPEGTPYRECLPALSPDGGTLTISSGPEGNREGPSRCWCSSGRPGLSAPGRLPRGPSRSSCRTVWR